MEAYRYTAKNVHVIYWNYCNFQGTEVIKCSITWQTRKRALQHHRLWCTHGACRRGNYLTEAMCYSQSTQQHSPKVGYRLLGPAKQANTVTEAGSGKISNTSKHWRRLRQRLWHWQGHRLKHKLWYRHGLRQKHGYGHWHRHGHGLRHELRHRHRTEHRSGCGQEHWV